MVVQWIKRVGVNDGVQCSKLSKEFYESLLFKTLYFYIIQDLNYTSIYCILILNNFMTIFPKVNAKKQFSFSTRIQTDYRKADAILVNCDIFVYRRNYQD